MKVVFPKIDGFPDINYGIAAILATLKESKHEAVLVDGTFIRKENRQEKILQRIRFEKPDVVAFSVTTDDYFETLRYVDAIKKLLPEIHVLLGGPFPTLVPDDVLAHTDVDSVCIGDGECLPRFLDWLDKKTGNMPQGFVSKQEGEIIGCFLSHIQQNLDVLPFIDLGLWNLDQYQKYWTMRKELPLVASRGCLFSCAFCSLGPLRDATGCTPHTYYRMRSPESVVEEIEHNLERFPGRFESVFFKDGLFGWDKRWFQRFTELYVKRGLHRSHPWSCAVRGETVTAEWAKKARESGCAWVRLAPETADERYRLEVYDKRTTNKQFEKAANHLNSEDIPFYMCMILGGPEESLIDIFNNLRYMLKFDPLYFGATTLRLIPGTDLHKRYKEHFGWRDEVPRLVDGGLHPALVDVVSRYLIPSVQIVRRFKKASRHPKVIQGWMKYLLNIGGSRSVPFFSTSRDIHALALSHIHLNELHRVRER